MSLLDEAAEEIRAALWPLKSGYYVKIVDDTIIVGNDVLSFGVTRREVEDNLHLSKAKKDFPVLLLAVAQHYAGKAVEADLNMARLVIESYTLKSEKSA